MKKIHQWVEKCLIDAYAWLFHHPLMNILKGTDQENVCDDGLGLEDDVRSHGDRVVDWRHLRVLDHIITFLNPIPWGRLQAREKWKSESLWSGSVTWLLLQLTAEPNIKTTFSLSRLQRPQGCGIRIQERDIFIYFSFITLSFRFQMRTERHWKEKESVMSVKEM